jgi:outer membrane usher protein
VPFGAIVSLSDESQDAKESRSAIVGDAGQVYLTGLPEKGRMLVKWGDEQNSQCRFNYDFQAINQPTILFLSGELSMSNL